jgi:hypothetical protein
MVTHRDVGLSFLLCLASSVGLAQSPAEDAPRTARERPPYPVVLRISQAAVEARTTREINRRTAVDQTILGTHATGECLTEGIVDTESVSSWKGASFIVTFKGSTHSRTVGHNGPAIIHSQTDTNFICNRRVTFDPRRGFVAGPSQISARTRLTFDDFDATRGGPVGRVVRRVASRRASEAHAEAERLAARDNERQIRAEFERALDERLDRINRRVNIGRFVNFFYGETEKLQVATRSTPTCVYLGIGKHGGPPDLATPIERPEAAPLELWVHTALLGEELAGLIDLAGRADRALGNSVRLVIMRAIPIVQDESQTLDVVVVGDWLVVAIRDQAPIADAPLASSTAEDSSPRQARREPPSKLR